MSVREVVRVESETVKLGVVDSHIASVRTQNEVQTAVRVMDGGQIGIASGVGHTDLNDLTRSAQESLIFNIAYPGEPERECTLSCRHAGDQRSVSELVELTSDVLGILRAEFPQFVFSYGVEQQ